MPTSSSNPLLVMHISQGSGFGIFIFLYISLIKACCLFLNLSFNENDICKLAYKLERIYNPYCGYQDPYGCGIGGFKRIEFVGVTVLSMSIYLAIYLMTMMLILFLLASQETPERSSKTLQKT